MISKLVKATRIISANTVEADSVCIHGDNPAALAFAKSIRDALKAEGITPMPMDNVISCA